MKQLNARAKREWENIEPSTLKNLVSQRLKDYGLSTGRREDIVAFQLTDAFLQQVLKTRENMEIDTVDSKVTSTLQTVQR